MGALLKLNSYYSDVSNHRKLLILQMGNERSVVEFVNGKDMHKILIIDNQYLMQLDEAGIVL